MQTPLRQIEIIEELLYELDWDDSDIAENIRGEYKDYRYLSYDNASELIGYLREYISEIS